MTFAFSFFPSTSTGPFCGMERSLSRSLSLCFLRFHDPGLPFGEEGRKLHRPALESQASRIGVDG